VPLSSWIDSILLWQWWRLTKLKKNFKFLSPKFSYWIQYFCLGKLFSAWASLKYSWSNISSNLWVFRSKGFSCNLHWASSIALLANTLSEILPKKLVVENFQHILGILQLLTQNKHACDFNLPSRCTYLKKQRMVNPKIKNNWKETSFLTFSQLWLT